MFLIYIYIHTLDIYMCVYTWDINEHRLIPLMLYV